MATIDELRLSFIFAGTMLSDGPGKAVFAERAKFEALFDSLQAAPRDGLDLPWRRDRPFESRFWKHYLHVPNPASIRGGMAWRKAVPLRSGLPDASVGPPDRPPPFGAEEFLYPFGLALVVTYYGRKSFAAEAWIDRAVAVARSPVAARFGGDGLGDLPLGAFASEWLQRKSRAVFGDDAELTTAATPYTVLSVVRGAGVDAGAAPAEGGDVHRLLFGAAALDPNWRAADLKAAPLAKGRLAARTGRSAGDVVFTAKRGRAIWTPSLFTAAAPPSSRSCYHRNQVLAALQVESLCSLAGALARRIGQGGTLPQPLGLLEEIAARQLSEIYAGDQATYRSNGLQRQIDDRGDKESIRTLALRQGVAFPH